MGTRSSGRIDYLERLSRWVTLTAFAIAIAAFVTAPLLALSWRHRPFLGFLVEPTLVVNDITGQGWAGRLAGINHPQRITRVAGRQITTTDEFDQVIAAYRVGDQVTVFTHFPDGTERLYPSIRLATIPPADMLRIFWLPYAIGTAYLAIGGWIYRLRGRTRPGRVLAFFCAITAVVCSFMYDLYTTHMASLIWTLAVAQVGGALISLAWRFPEEWSVVRRRSWILAMPYSVSVGLAVWGMVAILDREHPWAYIPAWGASYRYAAVGILVFFAVMFYRTLVGKNALVRQQARLVAAGSFVAFAPITFWFLAPLFGITIPFSPVFFLPTLLLFPLSVAIAILRFRLWEVDTFVNQAFVYGTVTAILAGVFAALIGLTQRMFIFITGEKSDAAIILSTLIIATVFTPLRAHVQAFVDRHLRDDQDDAHELRSFGEQVQTFVELNDVTQITKRLLEQAVRSLQAESGIIRLLVDGQLQTVHTLGPWRSNAHLSVALDWDGQRYGVLQLGPCQAKRSFSQHESELLQDVAEQVARAVYLAWPRFHANGRALPGAEPGGLANDGWPRLETADGHR